LASPGIAKPMPIIKVLMRVFGDLRKMTALVIGTVIMKDRLKLSDEETVAQIQENIYLQYFCGLKGFSIQAPFAPSLLVEIRKGMGIDVFEQLHQAIIN
jgi:hypothetical protein